MDTGNEHIAGDGRLAVLLIFILGIQIFNFIFSRQYSFPEETVEIHNEKYLTTIRPDKIVLEESPVDGIKTKHRLLPAEFTPFFFEKIPINSADEAMLATIKGIGPHLAQEIVDYREQFGPFDNSSDLTKMTGIGPKRADKLSSELNFRKTP